MKSKLFWALVGLNVLLVAGLFFARMEDNTAIAQARRPVDFMIIPGEVNTGNAGVVYVVDTTTGQLGAFVYDDSRKVLNVMPAIDLTRIMEGGRPR
jgi:hypothetical protein